MSLLRELPLHLLLVLVQLFFAEQVLLPLYLPLVLVSLFFVEQLV